MRRYIQVATPMVLAALLALSIASAQGIDFLTAAGQSGAGQGGAAAGNAAAARKADKTGTNPANFQDTFVLWNEYVELDGGSYTNQTVFEYKVPLQNSTMQARLRIPMVTSDLSGDTEFGIGDISARIVKTFEVTREYALVGGLESWWNTAREASLGRGKTSLGPLLVYARFYPRQHLIFAPAYQQRFSIAGDDSRPDISEGLLDLYLVKTLGRGERWLLLDPQFTIDYENDGELGGLVKLTYGTMVSPGHSFYLRPGIGFGETSVDWSLEAAYQIIW
ncbi:hypothetical protein LLH23_23635 [bacterium]|nr:hypothetical protein [bacterium]